MSTDIKFCGITNQADLEAAVALPIRYVGYNFAKGPRKISAEQAAAMTDVVPTKISRVGLFVNNNRDYMHRCLQAGKCDYVQLHGQEDEAEIKYWQDSYKVIKAFRIQDEASVAAAQASSADIVLLDAYVPGAEGGTGASWNYALMKHWTSLKPFMLAGGLNPQTVSEAICTCKPTVVDCASGIESEPGTKSVEKMQDFVDAVRACDV